MQGRNRVAVATLDQEYRLLMGKLPKEWRIKFLEEELERCGTNWVKMDVTQIFDWIETQMELKAIAHALGGVHATTPRLKNYWTNSWNRTWKPHRRW